MALADDIDDIRARIKSGGFTNEASVSQGIVLRLLHALQWPQYNTQVVCPEYPLEGSLRVDFALCHPPGKPIGFIEVKKIGQFRAECFADHKRTKYDEVLRDYGACTPVLFLLVSSVPQAKNRISDLEKFFIDLAVTANPEIQQTKDVPRPEWTIPGVTESNGKGGVPTAVLSLRKAFGLKPPPKKAATKKKRTRKA